LNGGNPNIGVIEQICSSVRAAVQTSGGVRTIDDAIERFNCGAYRVVVGSAAVEDPDMVNELINLRPAQVAIGLDARGSDVATHGWTQASGVDLMTMARRFASKRVGALIVTDISRDGMLTGPAVDQLRDVLEVVRVPVIARSSGARSTRTGSRSRRGSRRARRPRNPVPRRRRGPRREGRELRGHSRRG
jgi:phosphoribosylformimino-5-aminoimidazole carboxamide ribotide isomerase